MVNLQAQVDIAFKAMGDPARLAMLEQLSHGETTLGALAGPLPMSLPAVHKHLAVLTAAGLVACEKRGRERWCRLEPKAMRRAEDWIAARRRLWEDRLDALRAVVEAE